MKMYRLQLIGNKKVNSFGTNAMYAGAGMLMGSAVMQAFEKKPEKEYNKVSAVVAVATFIAGFIMKSATELSSVQFPVDAIKESIDIIKDVK